MTLAFCLLAVCVLYAAAFAAGWHSAASGRLGPDKLLQPSRRLVDPITARFQQWHDVEKMQAIRQKRWPWLWLLITLNNLLAVAFVSRTLYGVTMILPAYFTWRQGFSQGALLSRPMMRPRGAMLGMFVLEFGTYLVATALGINVTIAVLAGQPIVTPLTALLVVYPFVAAAIGTGAWLEIRLLRDRMQGVDLPPGVEMEALRAKAREMMKRRLAGPDRGEDAG
jgi:hypothetical protein